MSTTTLPGTAPATGSGPADLEALYRRIVVDVVGAGDAALADELFAEDFAARRTGLQSTFTLFGGGGPGAGGTATPGKAAFVGGLARIKASFPDWRCEVHDCIAADDLVAGAFAVHATFSGPEPFLGLPPNGVAFTIEEAGFLRFRDGQATEGWFVGDELALLAAIGARISLSD